MTGYVVSFKELPAEAKQVMQDIMDASIEHFHNSVENVAKELGITEGQATDVVYLRTRSRWTQQLENKLLQCYRDKIPVNIMEFE